MATLEPRPVRGFCFWGRIGRKLQGLRPHSKVLARFKAGLHEGSPYPLCISISGDFRRWYSEMFTPLILKLPDCVLRRAVYY